MTTLEKFGVELEFERLGNGVDVFLFKRKGMPIYLRASFFSGSRFDDIPGTAHFLEHMLVAGTKRFPSKNLLAEHIQMIGGDFGAGTNNCLLKLNVEIPESDDLEIGIDVLEEMLTKTLFDPEVIEKERGAILSELNVAKSNPRQYMWEVQRRLSLQGTNAGNSTLGTSESINAISREVLTDYKKNFISTGRISFIASGDVEMETLCKRLEKIQLPASDRFRIENALPIIRDKNLDVESYPGIDQLQVAFSFRTSIESYKEYCALKVISNILGVGRGSKLVTRLRYQNGLIYSVSSSVSNYPDWGQMVISLSCHKENLEKVTSMTFEELSGLKDMSEQELKNAQNKISKSFIRQHQTSESWVDFHENQAVFYRENLRTASDYVNTIEALTLSDIHSVIDKYFKKDNFVTAICGDY